jgi:hypothetical protein
MILVKEPYKSKIPLVTCSTKTLAVDFLSGKQAAEIPSICTKTKSAGNLTNILEDLRQA